MGLMNIKTCPSCKTDKPLSEYSKKAGRPGNIHYYCKVCKNAKDALWREQNREKINKSAKIGRLMRVYGLTQEKYQEMIKGGCDICKRTDVRLNVDHDHACCKPQGKGGHEKTCGKCVRGVLCQNCNAALGAFRDDTELIAKAIKYLETR